METIHHVVSTVTRRLNTTTHESFNVDLLYIHIASISAHLTTEDLKCGE